MAQLSQANRAEQGRSQAQDSNISSATINQQSELVESTFSAATTDRKTYLTGLGSDRESNTSTRSADRALISESRFAQLIRESNFSAEDLSKFTQYNKFEHNGKLIINKPGGKFFELTSVGFQEVDLSTSEKLQQRPVSKINDSEFSRTLKNVFPDSSPERIAAYNQFEKFNLGYNLVIRTPGTQEFSQLSGNTWIKVTDQNDLQRLMALANSASAATNQASLKANANKEASPASTAEKTSGMKPIADSELSQIFKSKLGDGSPAYINRYSKYDKFLSGDTLVIVDRDNGNRHQLVGGKWKLVGAAEKVQVASRASSVTGRGFGGASAEPEVVESVDASDITGGLANGLTSFFDPTVITNNLGPLKNLGESAIESHIRNQIYDAEVTNPRESLYIGLRALNSKLKILENQGASEDEMLDTKSKIEGLEVAVESLTQTEATTSQVEQIGIDMRYARTVYSDKNMEFMQKVLDSENLSGRPATKEELHIAKEFCHEGGVLRAIESGLYNTDSGKYSEYAYLLLAQGSLMEMDEEVGVKRHQQLKQFGLEMLEDHKMDVPLNSKEQVEFDRRLEEANIKKAQGLLNKDQLYYLKKLLNGEYDMNDGRPSAYSLKKLDFING